MKYIMNNMDEEKTVIRIRVKKCNGTSKPEYKKMSVDPSLTTFDVLRNLLIRAFDIKSNFTISYLSTDERGVDIYLTMLCDWDLEAAISTSCKPYLCLKVELRNSDKAIEDWDIIHKADVIHKSAARSLQSTGGGSTIFNNFFKSISKALGLKQEDMTPPNYCSMPPMSDVQFRMFQNKVGCLIHRDQFKLAVFQSGVEQSLRKVVWRHLLNVYPEHLNGLERMEHLKKKSNEYYELREAWMSRVLHNTMTCDEKHIMNSVKKDVLRTDRHHSFFSGADDNNSSLMLLNILVTYAFNHPEVSYCQGMSDLASPLLVVQKDEASAYVCFCSLMLRLKRNFVTDGIMMTSKFHHLSLLLESHDPEFAERLKSHRLEADLFFCYRWILLEMKREFPLEDALYVLEVMWSTLPTQLPGKDGIPLVDPEFATSSFASSHPQPSQGYINLKRKFSESIEQVKDATTPIVESPTEEASAVEVVDVNIAEYLELSRKSLEIERSLQSSLKSFVSSESKVRGRVDIGNAMEDALKEDSLHSKKGREQSADNGIHVKRKPSDGKLSSPEVRSLKSKMKLDLTSAPEENPRRNSKEEVEETCEESYLLIDSEKNEGKRRGPNSLPPPHDFGCGNPFLMFLCLSLLLQYRDRIMDHRMDYNDTAIFFDRMVRRHDARSVVAQARILYCAYMRCQKEIADSM